MFLWSICRGTSVLCWATKGVPERKTKFTVLSNKGIYSLKKRRDWEPMSSVPRLALCSKEGSQSSCLKTLNLLLPEDGVLLL